MSNSRNDLPSNPVEYIELFNEVTGGIGNWVANGTPDAGSIPEAIQQRYRDTCDLWSNGPNWVTDLAAPGRAAFSNLCKPWLDSQGSGDPVVDLPFTGGQCPGVGYRLRVRRLNVAYVSGCGVQNVPPSEFDSQILTGPITGTRVSFIGSPGSCGGNQVYSYEVLANGQWESISTSNLSRGWLPETNFEIVSVTRVDGLPDNCGNPPGEPAPNPNPRPDPGLDPEDEPFVRPTGRPVIPMPPIQDPFGDPVQLPNFPLPRIDGPGLFPEDEPVPFSEPGVPGTPEVIGGDEAAEGQASEGEVLTGVRVDVVTAPGFARVAQNVSTPTYVGACYVYLGWDGQLDLQPEGQFLESGQFFAAVPGMTHWRVRSAVGYTLTITPYYAQED